MDCSKRFWISHFKKLNCASLHSALSLPIYTHDLRTQFVFKHIKVVGQIPRNFCFLKFHDKPSKIIIDTVAHDLLDSFEITSVIVQMCKKNYTIAVEKFDFPRTLPSDELWKIALEYTYIYLSRYIQCRKPQYTNLYMDFSTSPGYPFNLWFKTKGDVPVNMISKDLSDPYETYYFMLAMKREKMDKVKAEIDFKMRSIMIPSIPFLVRQKKVFSIF